MASVLKRFCAIAIMSLLMKGLHADCPSGWQNGGGNCYLLPRMAVEHSAAVAFCGTYNATLVSVNSSLEYENIKSLIKLTSHSNLGQSDKYWTGLQHVGETYHWSDGTPFSQAAIHLIPGQSGQQCASWSPDTGDIEFESCDQQNRPFCKRSASLSYINRCNEEDDWQDISGACYKLFDDINNWSDARQQCLSQNGDLYIPSASSYIINRLVTCRTSVTHIWMGVTDITHPNILTMVNGTQSNVQLEMGDKSILEPGNTCVEVVTSTTSTLRFQTDVCDHEKQFICQKSYGTCQEGWEEYRGRCYQTVTTSRGGTTWFLAKQQCEDIGAQMLILNSMDEHMFIVQKLIQDKIPFIWLGFSDYGNPDVMNWVDGSAVNGSGVFSVWGHGFPQPVPNSLDCGLLQIGATNGSWSNGYCYVTRPFVCELHVGKTLNQQPSGNGQDACDNGWTRYQDQCFFFSDDRRTWEAASAACTATSGHLAIIPNPFVQSFLTVNIPGTGTGWIGAKLDTNNNQYYWTDNTEVSFDNYLPGEPDSGYLGFVCLEMTVTGSFTNPGGWIDQNCSLPQYYICQKPAVTTGSTVKPTPTYAWSFRCDPGWRLNSKDNFCYLVFTESPKTWLEASYDCQRRGAHLLSISGPNEQLHVEAILSAAYPTLQSFWIGASDSTDEGGWKWSDGSAFRYLHWYPGEPDNLGSTEDCAELLQSWNYQWNDGNCDSTLNYICKKPAKPPVTNPLPTAPTIVPPSQCIMGSLISGTYSIQSEFAFTSSSDLDPSHSASHIRLIPENRLAWRPSRNAKGEWVGVRFYQTMAVTGLTIAGEPDSFAFITSFKVQYQYTASSPWYWVQSSLNVTGQPQVFDGPTTDDMSNAVVFDSTIYAQALRVFPEQWGSEIAVRLEITGCIEEPCSMDYAVSGPLVVMDSGFTASSTSDDQHTPPSARLRPLSPNTSPSCWRSGPTLGLASNSPWLEVDLGGIKLLRGVTVMGNPDADEYVTLFQLLYRLHGSPNTYQAYQEPYGIPMNFTGNVDNNNSVTAVLNSVIPARYVRLVVLAFQGHPSLRLDLLVCSQATCRDIALLNGQHNLTNMEFTASSSRDPQHGPYHSRMGVQASGVTGDAWVAKFNDDHQYIQMDLGTQIMVWAVSTQGSEQLQQWVRAYTLAMSQDGQLFSSYSEDNVKPKVFDGNFDAASVRKQYLSKGTLARYIQLWPTDYEGGIALRWEIYGCPGPESGQYIGCFLDEEGQRDLPYEPLIDVNALVGPVSCRYHCFDKGYAYAGLQRGIACYCGTSYGQYGSSQNACTTTCLPPFEAEKCGGHLANSVYSTGLEPAHQYCQKGWAPAGDSCYEVLEDEGTWFDAQETCRQLGAELVSLHSRADNDFLFSIVTGMAVQGKYGSVWIGLNDIAESYFYQWNDGSEVIYTNWDLNMPISSPGQEQHCVALNNQTGGWKTVFCEESMMSACKAPRIASPIPHLPLIVEGCEGSAWNAFQWSCYAVVPESQAWDMAQRSCHAMGATLVRINDRYEQAFVSSLLSSKSGHYWTDVSDTSSPSVFTFSDLSTIIFTYWGPSQPAMTRSCVGVEGGQTGGLWFTLSCSSPQSSVCEKPRVGFTPYPTQSRVPPDVLCPQNWYPTLWSCFQVNSQVDRQRRLTWAEARADCQDKGADLASFHSSQDLQSVWRDSMAGHDGDFWIGLQYNDQDKSLKWSDGSGVNFVQWALGETDSMQGLKNCGELLVESGDMAHQFCFALRNWVCSIPRGAVLKPRTTLAVPTTGAPGSCSPLDDRWTRYNRACYLVQTGEGDTALTWREANIWCQKLHATLVSITSPLEQLFLQTLIQSVSSDGLWIGLSNLDMLHGFRWADGSPVAYTNWNVNEPDNYGYLEYCVSMLPKNGKWKDDVCTRRRGFVCKQASYITPAPTAATTARYGYCPAGYGEFRGRCLRVYGGSEGEQLLIWEDAWQDCRRRGPGHNLVSIQDMEENLKIVTLMGMNQLSAWIGLKRLVDSTFIWTDNSEVTFTNWDAGEPSGGTQSCVYMKGTSSSAGEWSDAPCFQKANYVCEAPKDQSNSPGEVPNPCDAKLGFHPYKSGCYQYVSLSKNYSAAMQDCHTRGADLVTINDAFSQAFIRLFVAGSIGLQFKSDGNQTIWIGLNDMRSQGVYTWALGWPVTYTNWAPGEPTRGAGKGCVSMRPDGRWVDDNCSREIVYVCAIINESYTPFTPTPPKGQCPDAGWVIHSGFCYLLRGHDTQTFYEAQLRCQDQQSFLTSVHDNDTARFLVSLMVSQTPYHFWLGLYESSDEGFSWVDHSAVDFTNWATGEPSRTNAEGIVERCVGLDPRTQQWSDLDCALRLGYICRRTQELDNSIKTRPPVIVPYETPPTLYPVVSQNTPTPILSTVQSPVTSSSAMTSRPRPSVFTSTMSARSSASVNPYSSSMPSTTVPGVLPTKEADAGSDSGLSSGAVAGIVISVLVVMTVVAVPTLLFIRQRQQRPRQSLSTENDSFSNPVYNFGSTSRSEEGRGVRHEEVSLGVIVSNNQTDA